LSLIDTNNSEDPLGLMAIPRLGELMEYGDSDPMDEFHTNPAPLITRRYPDRAIMNVTNTCGVYCRFCQRKRNIGEIDYACNMEHYDEALKYIAEHEYIRDVLLTGGDPLTLSNDNLEMILMKLRKIKHVEIIRIESRIPASIPQRIDQNLVKMLKKYHPLYLNLHFNHPYELTEESKNACNRFSDAGIPLGNQMVLLRGVNDNKYLVLDLNKKLLEFRVKPYYVFFAKNISGTTHFNCNIEKGLEIVDFLRGNLSGLGIPTFIVNATGGAGKVPILNKKFSISENDEVILTTWEDKMVSFPNPHHVNY